MVDPGPQITAGFADFYSTLFQILLEVSQDQFVFLVNKSNKYISVGSNLNIKGGNEIEKNECKRPLQTACFISLVLGYTMLSLYL